jgi:microcin C transport system substrate-binding protein
MKSMLTRRDFGRMALATGFAAPLLGGVPALARPKLAAGAGNLTTLKSFAEFGEPAYPADFTQFKYVNPAAPKGGTIRLAAFGTFERLDTIRVGGAWAAGIGNIMSSLMTGSGDELSSYYPMIAESVAVPDDLSYAVFTLDPRATWQDGTPILAEDFVFAFDFIKANSRPLLKQFWVDIEKATLVSERQVRFDFATRDNWRTLGKICGFGPMPKRWWQASGRDIAKSYVDPVLSEGPYRITKVDPGRSVTYERIDGWWAKDLPVSIGQNNADRITYTYYRDQDVMFEAFMAGEFDYWEENSAKRWATEYDRDVVRSGRVQKLLLPDNTPTGFVGFVFNTRRPIFQDLRVRQAIALLYDFEWTNRNVFYSQYVRAKSYFPNSDYGTADFPLPEGEEKVILERFGDQVPADIFTTPFVVSETDGSGQIRPQLREAWRLLKEAGWEVRDGTLTSTATGQPFRFEYLDNDDGLLRMVQPFVANLARAGIKAEIRVVDTPQYQRRVQDFDYDMIYIAANFFPPPGPEMEGYFMSTTVDQQDSANWAGIKDPVVDALIKAIIAEHEDLDRIKATTRALDRVLLRGNYIIPSYYLNKNRLAFWDRFARPETPPYYGTGFPDSWWIDPAKDAAQKRGQG